MARSEARMTLNKLFEMPTEPYPKLWTTRTKLPAIPVGTQSWLRGFKVRGDQQMTSDGKCSTARCKGGGGMLSEDVTQQKLGLLLGNEPLTSSPLQVFGWLQPHKEPAASRHPCPEASTRSIPRKQKHTLFRSVLPVIILCLSKPTKSVCWIEKSILNQKSSKDTAEIFKGHGGKRSSSAPFAHKGY